MIRQVLEQDSRFGVVLILSGVEALGPIAEPFKVGCCAKIIEVNPLPDGRMNLMCVGQELFRIREMNRSLPYLVGQVETFITEQPRTLDIVRGARMLTSLVHKYLQMVGALKPDENGEESDLNKYLQHLTLPGDPTMLLYTACALLHIPTWEKQTLLEMASIPHLYDTVLRLYKRELAIYAGVVDITNEDSRRSAWLN